MEDTDDWDHAKRFIRFKPLLEVSDRQIAEWLSLGPVKAHADCLGGLLWFDYGPAYGTVSSKFRVAGFPNLQN